ncbi:MAG: hypothetical protein K9N07_10355 [Candidatus Cloacimonetes bacterium]|nr:hypothetical protein [Candidatus Cloacimonadota bacterium]MCF8012741.1 hypothetical protein [Candidatus Woesearchaeota archaeon]
MEDKEIVAEVSKTNLGLATLVQTNKEMLKFFSDMITPGLCGMDWSNIMQQIEGMTEFKIISSLSDTLDNYKELIHEHKRIMIQFSGGKGLTLDKGKSIIQQYFSSHDYLEQIFYEKEAEEIQVTFLLMR